MTKLVKKIVEGYFDRTSLADGPINSTSLKNYKSRLCNFRLVITVNFNKVV